jgi:TPR repeat protein
MRVRFAAALTTSLMLVTLAGDALAGDALTSCLAASEGNYSSTKHVECLHQDADQGDRLSQYLLASAYFTGKFDLPKNYAEASKWYLRAANQGLSGAQFILGAMYAKGNGVPRDLVRALMWLNLAMAQHNPDATETRDRVEGQMSPAQIAEAQKLASEFKPKPER